MNCRDIARLSSAYLDGELSPEKTRTVRGHLRTCAQCEAALAGESALVEGLAAFEAELDPPSGLYADIRERLADEEIADAKRVVAPWVRWVFGGGMLACAAAAFLFWFSVDVAPPPVAETIVTPSPMTEPVPTVFQEQEQERLRAYDRYRRALNETRLLAGAEPQLAVAASLGDRASLADKLAWQAAERRELRQATATLLEAEWSR